MSTPLLRLASRVQIQSTWLGPGKQERDRWRVTLGYQGRTLTVEFAKGPKHHGARPKRHEVLATLLDEAAAVDGPRDFPAWARRYGVEVSRTSERLYQQVRVSASRLRELLGDDYNLFQEAPR